MNKRFLGLNHFCRHFCHHQIWLDFVTIFYSIQPKDSVVGEAVKYAKSKKWQIECMGVSTQRGTGTFWDAKSGKVLNNFVTWQDIRCKKFVDEINGALATKIIRISRFITDPEDFAHKL